MSLPQVQEGAVFSVKSMFENFEILFEIFEKLSPKWGPGGFWGPWGGGSAAPGGLGIDFSWIWGSFRSPFWDPFGRWW